MVQGYWCKDWAIVVVFIQSSNFTFQDEMVYYSLMIYLHSWFWFFVPSVLFGETIVKCLLFFNGSLRNPYQYIRINENGNRACLMVFLLLAIAIVYIPVVSNILFTSFLFNRFINLHVVRSMKLYLSFISMTTSSHGLSFSILKLINSFQNLAVTQV